MRIRTVFTKVSAIACLAFAACAPSIADAGWGSFGGSWGASYGSYGGGSSGGYAVNYGSSGGYAASYGSYGSYGGGTGPVRRLLSHIGQKIHNLGARRAYYGSYGSYGSYGGASHGYVANYGSSGGAYTSGYGSSGGGYYSSSYSGGSSGGFSTNYGSTGAGAIETSYGSVGTSHGASYGSVGGGAYYGASSVTTNESVNSLVSTPVEVDDTVMLTVAVPAAAKIYVNDNPTTSVGAVRQFVSRGLEYGKSYQFKVRAEVAGANGKTVSEEKTLTLAAGQNEALEFNLADAETPIETAVTVHVPEGAQVILAGNETSAVGAVRTFRTSQLTSGKVWDDYTIQVKLGDEIKEQKVRLIAGDQLELSFDFGATPDRLAAR